MSGGKSSISSENVDFEIFEVDKEVGLQQILLLRSRLKVVAHKLDEKQSMQTKLLRGDIPKKTGFFGDFFPKGKGGSFQFLSLPRYFWYAKIILMCQNMFYNSGEVISDQFHHLILI